MKIPISRALIALAALAALAAACGEDEEFNPLAAHTGFVTLESTTYQLDDGAGLADQTTDEARLWYSFIPAQTNPSERPLFVFFNGGPGAATSSYLLSFNTGPRTLDQAWITDQKPVSASPADWSALGNLLYIDARNTGFSYSIGTQESGFAVRNFNPYVDAADMTRALLRFLASCQPIQRNPVILVGESYGGMRAALMLNMLLNYRRYATEAAIFRDSALSDEIQAHLDARFPDQAGSSFAPQKIAYQFGRQILIEPFLFGERQDQIAGELLERAGSPVHKIAAETGKTFVTCQNKIEDPDCQPLDNALEFVMDAGRDVYMYNQQKNVLDLRAEQTTQTLLELVNYQQLVDHDPRTVPEFKAQMRQDAYHYGPKRESAGESWRARYQRERLQLTELNPEETESELCAAFGELGAWDTYHTLTNDSIFYVYDQSTAPHAWMSTEAGRLFLENLLLVKTFVTSADYDLVVYPPSIPESIRRYAEVEGATPQYKALDVTLKAGSFGLPENTTRTITLPNFVDSGHTVTMTQPVTLLNELKPWLTK